MLRPPGSMRSAVAGHSPQRERPLAGYATLTATFMSAAAAFTTWFVRSGRRPPERMALGDMALLAVASHKAARTVTHDRVASALRAPFTEFQHDAAPAEVSERARGHGLRLALGELLTCPYCMGMWFSGLFTASLLVFPRATRWVASELSIFFASEVLQVVYRRVEIAGESAPSGD
jgi:hypothetical protein